MCRWNYDCSSFAVTYVFTFTPSAQIDWLLSVLFLYLYSHGSNTCNSKKIKIHCCRLQFLYLNILLARFELMFKTKK